MQTKQTVLPILTIRLQVRYGDSSQQIGVVLSHSKTYILVILQVPIITHHLSISALDSMMAVKALFGNWEFF